jgi:hypothetical protein
MLVRELNEDVGQSVLYHGTSLPWLVRIIETDRLTAEGARSASLTRSPAIASKFATTRTLIDLEDTDIEDQLIQCLPSGNSVCGAVIVFDRNILVQRHKIVPFDDGFKSGSPTYSEYEERIVGPVQGVVKAIRAIKIQKPMEYDRFKIEATQMMPDLARCFAVIDRYRA